MVQDSLYERFKAIFDYYKGFYAGNEKNAGVSRILKHEIPQILMNALNLDPQKYKIVGSVGVGNKTETPWLSIFDLSITNTAQKGFYPVFLFRADMSGMYLSLNQGTTYLQHKFKGMKPKQKMLIVSDKLRGKLLYSAEQFPLEKIQLMSSTNNAKNYENANIFAKFYSKDHSFNDNELTNDILSTIHTINQIKTIMGMRSLDETIDDLLFQEEIEDTKFQEDILISHPTKTEEAPQKPKFNSNKTNVRTQSSFKRDPGVAKEALINADYSCEMGREHRTFISLVTGRNFVEAHHLIPISKQSDFQYSLDVPGNIVSLCPNCHRKIHHAKDNEKKQMLRILLEKRKHLLNKFGIDVDIDQIFKFYDI